jgi:hypothetical protein
VQPEGFPLKILLQVLQPCLKRPLARLPPDAWYLSCF